MCKYIDIPYVQSRALGRTRTHTNEDMTLSFCWYTKIRHTCGSTTRPWYIRPVAAPKPTIAPDSTVFNMVHYNLVSQVDELNSKYPKTLFSTMGNNLVVESSIPTIRDTFSKPRILKINESKRRGEICQKIETRGDLRNKRLCCNCVCYVPTPPLLSHRSTLV